MTASGLHFTTAKHTLASTASDQLDVHLLVYLFVHLLLLHFTRTKQTTTLLAVLQIFDSFLEVLKLPSPLAMQNYSDLTSV